MKRYQRNLGQDKEAAVDGAGSYSGVDVQILIVVTKQAGFGLAVIFGRLIFVLIPIQSHLSGMGMAGKGEAYERIFLYHLAAPHHGVVGKEHHGMFAHRV